MKQDAKAQVNNTPAGMVAKLTTMLIMPDEYGLSEYEAAWNDGIDAAIALVKAHPQPAVSLSELEQPIDPKEKWSAEALLRQAAFLLLKGGKDILSQRCGTRINRFLYHLPHESAKQPVRVPLGACAREVYEIDGDSWDKLDARYDYAGVKRKAKLIAKAVLDKAGVRYVDQGEEII